MSSRVDLISLSTEPLRLAHESQFIVMMLQPGSMDLSMDGGPTERLEYIAGDIALCRRHIVGLVESPDRMKKLRFELSDLHLNEAAGEANRQIELQSIPKLKDSRIRALMTAVNIERASGFPSGQLFLQFIVVALAVSVQTYSLSMKARRPIKGGLIDIGRRNVMVLVRSRISEDISLVDMEGVTGLSSTHFSHTFQQPIGESPHQFALQQRVQCIRALFLDFDLRKIVGSTWFSAASE